MSDLNPVQKRKNLKSGFALMEVFMAAWIALIAFTGVMGLVTYTIRANYATASVGTILSMSNDLFTTFENTAYDLIGSGSDTVDSTYTRSWTVTTSSKAKTVTLTVTHDDPLGRSHTRTFTEVFSDPDASGFIDSSGSLP